MEHIGLPWWLRWQRICLQFRSPGFDPRVRKIPWRREWQPTSVFLPGEFHGQRRLANYNPWGHKESDTTATNTLTVVHCCVTQGAQTGILWWPRGVGWRRVWGTFKRMCVCVCIYIYIHIHIYIWLIYIVVQKPTWYHEVIILQLKKIKNMINQRTC